MLVAAVSPHGIGRAEELVAEQAAGTGGCSAIFCALHPALFVSVIRINMYTALRHCTWGDEDMILVT
jgi:hypothetical protein